MDVVDPEHYRIQNIAKIDLPAIKNQGEQEQFPSLCGKHD